MNELLAILGSVTIVSVISFAGAVFIGLREGLMKRLLMVLVAFSSGTLIASAFLDLLPEALNELYPVRAFSFVILGIVVFFAMEKFLYWRHCHEGECPVHMFAYVNLVGDGVHNFIDGMIIAATFLTSFDLGFATTLAVVFHEIPQEIGDFGVQVYGGLSKRRALAYNFASALTAIVGAVIVYFFRDLSVVPVLVPFAAGGFIYIAATDLMPELHRRSQAAESVVQFLSILMGLALIAYISMAFAV